MTILLITGIIVTVPNTGDVVFDLMMGSGTNIKAALNCGSDRKGIGIDIDQGTCEKARAHIAASFPRDTGQSGTT